MVLMMMMTLIRSSWCLVVSPLKLTKRGGKKRGWGDDETDGDEEVDSAGGEEESECLLVV